MGDYVFKKNDAGIRKLLQSDDCLKCMESYAGKVGTDPRPFVGFDRAKVFVKQDKK